jgi:hypothetical protein
MDYVNGSMLGDSWGVMKEEIDCHIAETTRIDLASEPGFFLWVQYSGPWPM